MDFPEEVFPKSWLNSSVPVIFDFCGLSTNEQNEIKNILWCLLPQKDIARAVVVRLNRKDFVAITYEREQLFQAKTEEKRQVLSQQQFQKQVRRQKPTQTHYYDPHKKQFVKRERL